MAPPVARWRAGWWCECGRGGRHLEDGAGEQSGVPARPVEDVVMPRAHQDQVAGLGSTTLLPRDDVVCLAPVGRRSQPGKRQCWSRSTSTFQSGGGMARVACP